MEFDRPLSFRDRAPNRKISSTITITSMSTSKRFHFKSPHQPRLFPNRDRAPAERSGFVAPRLMLPACIQAAVAEELVSARGPQIPPETFQQNFGSATRTLRRMRK